MHVVLWDYEVLPERTAEFVWAYDSAGTWVNFFSKGDGYRGTELLRQLETPGHYLTIDRWDSAAHYERFREENGAEYEAINDECERLTVAERCIGTYSSENA